MFLTSLNIVLLCFHFRSCNPCVPNGLRHLQRTSQGHLSQFNRYVWSRWWQCRAQAGGQAPITRAQCLTSIPEQCHCPDFNPQTGASIKSTTFPSSYFQFTHGKDLLQQIYRTTLIQRPPLLILRIIRANASSIHPHDHGVCCSDIFFFFRQYSKLRLIDQ